MSPRPHPWRWAKDKGRRIKRRVNSWRPSVRRQAKHAARETRDTAVDAGSDRLWGEGLSMPRSTSSRGTGYDTTPSYGGGGSRGGGDGCNGCNPLDGCDFFMLLQLLTGVYVFKIAYYNLRGYPWHDRHMHRPPR